MDAKVALRPHEVREAFEGVPERAHGGSVPEPVLPEPSVARRLDRELFLLLGGTAALLMQVSHPLVAAGVEHHSDFRRDPVGRLRRTLNTTLAVVFAEPDAARAALRRIDRRPGPVPRPPPDGPPHHPRPPAPPLSP